MENKPFSCMQICLQRLIRWSVKTDLWLSLTFVWSDLWRFAGESLKEGRIHTSAYIDKIRRELLLETKQAWNGILSGEEDEMGFGLCQPYSQHPSFASCTSHFHTHTSIILLYDLTYLKFYTLRECNKMIPNLIWL